MMLYSFLIFLFVLTYWPQFTVKHMLWAAAGAILMFPLKKLWDWVETRWWESFKVTFLTAFKKTPGGQEFMKAFYESRARGDAKAATEHPELAEVLHCKKCLGKGCEDCGGTGWA